MIFVGKERPYYTVNDFYLEKFHDKVYKISLNGDFTCPNRDGTLSKDGCIYCSESGSAEFGGNKLLPLKKQFEEVLKMMQKKWKSGKYIAYFQANTNTYGPLSKLKSLFEEALTLNENIIGLSIATRPDCLNDEIIEYLADLNLRTFLTIEIGLQTIHESTAKLINRGHTLKDFEEAVLKLRKKNIHVVCHIINGLPGESKEMMMDTLNFVNKQDIQGLKIHMLYIIKNTPLERYYLEHPYPILTLSEYTELVAEQIEHLRTDIVLHRLTGDAMKEDLIEPLWSLKKFVVTNEIDKILRKRNTYQGYHYN